MNTVTAEQMTEIDRRAQEEFGVPQPVLMENAGKAAFEVILEDIKKEQPGSVAILCGKGNNGGDGFVVARHLSANYEGSITVYAPALDAMRPGSALDNLKKIMDKGIAVRDLEDFEGEGHAAIVDALFGTGFKGEIKEPYARITSSINSSGARVYAIDVPSGLDATTGEAAADCVRADKTVTFGLAKTGFYKGSGPEICGEIVVKEIGFPKELLEEYV